MSPRHQTKRIFGPYFASDYHNADLKGGNPTAEMEKKIENFFKIILHYIFTLVLDSSQPSTYCLIYHLQL